MKKLLILPLLLLLVTGCNISTNNETERNELNKNNIYFYIDENTCVEYIVYDAWYSGGITPRLNRDGTIMLNEECLNKKGGNR